MAAFAHAVRALDDVPSALGRDRARWLASGAAVLATGAAVLVGAWSGLAPEAGPRRVAAASIVPFSSPSASAALSEASDGVAVPTPAQRTIRSIHASLMFSCVLTGGGEVQCWGKTGSYFGRPEVDGHIGDDELPSHAPPLDFGGRKVVSLAVDYWSTHLCALLDDGAARCWGDNGHGQLGLGPDVGDIGDSAGESPATTPNLPLEDIRAIYTQSGWTCALTGPLGNPKRGAGGSTVAASSARVTAETGLAPAVPIDFGGASPLAISTWASTTGVLGWTTARRAAGARTANISWATACPSRCTSATASRRALRAARLCPPHGVCNRKHPRPEGRAAPSQRRVDVSADQQRRCALLGRQPPRHARLSLQSNTRMPTCRRASATRVQSPCRRATSTSESMVASHRRPATRSSACMRARR